MAVAFLPLLMEAPGQGSQPRVWDARGIWDRYTEYCFFPDILTGLLSRIWPIERLAGWSAALGT